MATTPFSMPDLGPLELEILRRRIAELRGEEDTRQEGLGRTAGAARTAYEGMAGAPLPEQHPLESGTQQLFGDMASIISRRPEFGERTREDVKQRGAMLLQQRMQNIQLLRDRYQEEAAKVGKLDPIKALELSEKTERMNKLLEQLHERDITGFREGREDARNTERVRGGISEANIRADADRYQADASRSASLGKLPEDKFDARRLDIFNQFKDTKGKGGILKNNRPLAAASILGITRAGEASDAWQSRTVQDLENIFGKGKMPKEFVTQLQFWKATHFPPQKKDKRQSTDETPVVGGVTTEAPMPRVTIEAPGGEVPPRAQPLVDEALRLLPRTTGARGPSELVVQRRHVLQLQKIMQQLQTMGVRLNVLNLVEGTETQGFSDSSLNEEAR